MSKKSAEQVSVDVPTTQDVPEVPENFKPRSKADLDLAIKAGIAIRVQPTDAHIAKLEQVDRFEIRVGDKVISDDKGPVVLHLPNESKYAMLVRCQEPGCDEIRVVRTSDLLLVSHCVEHAKKHRSRKGKKAKAVETIEWDGKLEF